MPPNPPIQDVFISYAREDQMAIADPLVAAFSRAGISIWQDVTKIGWGESLVGRVNEGLSTSRHVIAIISNNYLWERWPMAELEAIRNLELSSTNAPRLLILVKNQELHESFLKKYPLFGSKRFLVWTGNADKVVEAYRDVLKSQKDGSGGGRVCMISSEYPPQVLGGLGIHVARLSAELGGLVDLDLILQSPEIEYDTPPKGVVTHSMALVKASYDDPLSWLRFGQHAFNMVRTMNRQPEIIHCHDWVTVLGGIKCRWLLNIPLVFHVHLPNRTPFCSSVENLGILCADLITVNSRAMREQLKDRFPEKNVEVIPNGVDTKTFTACQVYQDTEQYILFVGRLVEQKGINQLLRAFVHIQTRFPKYQLWIAGAGPCDLAYQRLSNCLFLGDKVKFLGSKTPAELSQLYQQASVVVVPSVYEPFGMTALEAMACGRPVVASRTGGLKDLIQQGITGCLFEPGDHLDLAQTVMRLLARRDLREELGGNAGRIIHDEASPYRWPLIARNYVDHYERIKHQELPSKRPDRAGHFINQIKKLAYSFDHICADLFSWIT